MKISDIEKNLYKGLAEFISQKIRDGMIYALDSLNQRNYLMRFLKE